jgi:hypothetical protein
MTKEQKLRRRLRALLRQIQQITEQTDWYLNYWEDAKVWRFLKSPDTKDQTECYLECLEDNLFRLAAVKDSDPKHLDPDPGIERIPASKQILPTTSDEVLLGSCEISPDGAYSFEIVSPDGQSHRDFNLWTNIKPP